MPVRSRTWSVDVGSRIDGTPWPLQFTELTSGLAGPATAIVGGMYGDKPLGCLAVHELRQRLMDLSELSGRIILAPAVNLPAFARGTRVNPDHRYLNRQFPGSPTGFLTDQLAHHLSRVLLDEVDTLIDLHSGTPEMELAYTYDFGDTELSASFGYLPVVTGFKRAGQLGWIARDAGVGSLLPEFGGGVETSTNVGVEGCLNVLRTRGHLAGRVTGPKRVPLVEGRQLMLASTAGILRYVDPPLRPGDRVARGDIAHITSVLTGQPVETFTASKEGLVLMASTAPLVVAPGDFVAMVGHANTEIDVPNA